MHGKELPADYLKPIGSKLTYWLNDPQIKSKLDEKGDLGVLIGFNPSLLSYRVLTSSGKIINTKHVKFCKSNTTILNFQDNASNISLNPTICTDNQNAVTPTNSPSEDNSPRETPVNTIKEEVESDSMDDESADEETVSASLRPSLRNWETLKKPKRFGYLGEKLPSSIEEALTIPVWKASTLKEFQSIEDQGVWEEVDKDEVTNPLKTVPVYKVKENAHGEPPTYKTRLCVQGFNQKYGLDYMETYAPTGRIASLQALLTFAMDKKLELLQLDIKGAFLHADLDKDVYIFNPPCSSRKGKFLKLKKSL